MRPLRIAMLAHSTLPRGGVVHAMSLCEALVALGCEAVLHAPDAGGLGFFREAACATRPFRVAPAPRDTADMVAQRIEEYVTWFGREENRGFDVYHAHDGLSGAALAALKRQGLIAGFVRTVHHLDAFVDPRLAAWQDASIREASALLTVSDLWRRRIHAAYARDARICGNGVDLARYRPARDGREDVLRARWGLGDGPVILAVGGVEARKNTVRMLWAFGLLAAEHPTARFVIAGGASLLDHGAYQAEFRAALERSSVGARVVRTGPVEDADMPALYRLADALAFASVKEGFGLCALEAMACGTPAVVARAEPFVEFLNEDEALFCDPFDPLSIAAAMRAALSAGEDAAARGFAAARRHPWRAVAEAALATYLHLREPVLA